MICKTFIDKTIEGSVTEIDQVMERTINTDIDIQVKVGRIQGIIIETIQEEDLSEVKTEVEIGGSDRQTQPRARTLTDERENRSMSRSCLRVSTNRDRIRCYRCREYDHFMVQCPNTPTSEELDHSNV